MGGRLAFQSPVVGGLARRTVGVAHSYAKLAYSPEPGSLFVFPGYLFHVIEVYRGERPRVAIAFNAEIDPAEANLAPTRT